MPAKFEEIQRLYLEKLSGIISDADMEKLEQSIQRDEESRSIWDSLTKKGQSLDLENTLHSIDIQTQLDKVKAQEQQKKQPNSLKRVLFIAASLALLLTCSYFIYFYTISNPSQAVATKSNEQVKLILSGGKTVLLDKQEKQSLTIGGIQIKLSQNKIESVAGSNAADLNTLIVPNKRDYHITLPDGTEVTLNAQSKLRFPAKFIASQREVYVEGEAYFDVAPHADQPFIVHTPLAKVHVLGTTFNVNTYNKNLFCTSLISGKVNIQTADGKALTLKPGFEAVYNKETGLYMQAFEQENRISWLNGVLYFYDMPLEELKNILPRWFDKEVVFSDKSIAKKRISGLIEKDKLPSFIKYVTGSAGVKCELKNNAVYISRR
ncbi:FecR family protein [Olivibacter ginsenosidimutans]